MSKKNKKTKYQYTANVDGACAGNPGPMGIGGVIVDSSGKTIHTFSKAMGKGTNNEAEYLAVITALEYIADLNPESVLIISDSQIVVYQINGTYSINHPHLAKLHGRASKIINRMNCKVVVEWNPRENNEKADALASAAAGMPMAPITDAGEVKLWEPDPDYKPDAEALASLPEVNWECKANIKRLISLADKARFKDYAKIKSGGQDKYSRADPETLKQYIAIRFGQAGVDWLIEAVESDQTDYGKKVLRWAARGLPPPMALKKVSVDMEIQANAAKYRSVG